MGVRERLQLLEPSDIEIGISEALQRHATRHVVPPKPVSTRVLDFERRRPRWLRECVGEATGVFFFVFTGVASIASFVLHAADGDAVPVTAYSNFLQIGLAFGLGIMIAVTVAAPTSGGHFNPAITISLAIWQGFPWKKVPYYIVSQILDTFVAGSLIMGIYWEQISAFLEATIAAGSPIVSASGPAGIFVSFPGEAQKSLGHLFLTEFFVDSFIGIVTWAAIDPANSFVSPTTVPVVIGLGYTLMIWGFAPITISTNLARDFGCRILVGMFFGKEAFSYHSYSWIAILVNIPATLFATLFYETFLRDSIQKIHQGSAPHEEGEEGLQRYLSEVGVLNKM